MAGEELTGPYTLAMRTHYMEYRTAKYLIDHPGSTQHTARRAARSAWRNKVLKAIARLKDKS